MPTVQRAVSPVNDDLIAAASGGPRPAFPLVVPWLPSSWGKQVPLEALSSPNSSRPIERVGEYEYTHSG